MNSFTAGSRTVTFNVSPDVKSMDFTGATNNPSVVPTNSCTIRGSLTLISPMSWGDTGATITFDSTGTTVNLTTAGIRLGVANIIITGSGTFNFQDNTTVDNQSGSGTIKPQGSGTINTNNHNLTSLAFQGTNNDTINLGSSTITVTGTGGSFSVWSAATGETINAGTSNIVVSGATVIFEGAGKTYYDVHLTGTPIQVNSSNTYNSLTISAGKTINFQASKTQTITTLNAVGTSGSHILFRSTSSPSQASLCVTNWNIAYVDAKDMNASCTAVSDCTGINSGNDTNWDFCTGRAFLLNLL